MNQDSLTAVERSPAAEERAYMQRALRLAQNGLFTTDPNPRVGCVLVQGKVIVGEGWHARAGEFHAEVLAIRAADSRTVGSTAYVTLEPCNHTGRTPPCTDALIAAGVARVVCATLDPNPRVSGAGVARLRAADIVVSVGLLADQARELNPGFFSRFERARPFVRLKMAMSLDARTALTGGGREWISGEAARADVQILRARSSAILTGAGTVRIDNPRLNVRLNVDASGAWVRQPLRVVLDPQLSCDLNSAIFQDPGALVFTSPNAHEMHDARAESATADESRVRRVERVPLGGGGLDLAAVLSKLNALEVNELLVECGPRLGGAFLEAELVDEWIVYIAPSLLGCDAAPLTRLTGLQAHLLAFKFQDVRRVGADVRLVLTPLKKINRQ